MIIGVPDQHRVVITQKLDVSVQKICKFADKFNMDLGDQRFSHRELNSTDGLQLPIGIVFAKNLEKREPILSRLMRKVLMKSNSEIRSGSGSSD